MIKANELRTGNIVMRLNKFDRLPRITKIIGMMIFQAEKEPEEFDPIPITEEWLRRMGFKMLPIGKYEDAGNWIRRLQANGDVMHFDDRHNNFSYNGCTIWTSPKFVHQLQNLYFALTGEELIIKEKA